MTDELRLAAVLVGLHGHAEDLPLLYEVRETDFDTWCGLGGMPEPGADPDELRRWARDLDDSLFGTDPADEPLFTWTGLAHEQGLVELARAALIRRLDDIDFRAYCDARESKAMERRHACQLSPLASEFEQLGDTFRRCAPSGCTCPCRPGPGTASRPSSGSPGWSGRKADSARRYARCPRCGTPSSSRTAAATATARWGTGSAPTWAPTSSRSTTRSPGPRPPTRCSPTRPEPSPWPPGSSWRDSPGRPGRTWNGSSPGRPTSVRIPVGTSARTPVRTPVAGVSAEPTPPRPSAG